ncbi:MAG: acyltransferase family protein [Candidatus Binatia bacterium]
MASTTQTRRHDIDCLRVFATYLLFLFHVGMVFNPAPFYHIRNAEVSGVFLVVCGFISLWHMPLFFLLAGWSVFSSFSARGGSGFLKERVSRLLVPLIAGCLLFGPLIKYVELSSGLDLSFSGLRAGQELQAGFREIIPSGLGLAPPFDESLIEFWPSYFTNFDRFSWSHLWFIAYLFTFSLLYRPLFAWLGRREPKRENDRKALSCRAVVPPRWVYFPILPLVLIQVGLRPHWPGIQNLYDDWANFAFYSTFMIAGFLMARYPDYEAAIHREYKRAFGLGLASVVVLLGAVVGVISYEPLVLALTGVAGWSFVVAMLGFAARHLRSGSPLLSRLAEGSLPIYILHQPAIVLIGYPLISLEAGIAVKFALLLVASLVAAQGCYELFVRHVSLLRFAFGMKARVTTPVAAATIGVKTVPLVLPVTVLVAWAATAEARNPLGTWWADQGSAKVEIQNCAGNRLCGTVVWLRSPFDEQGCSLRDSNNPNPKLRNRPVVGIEILRGLEASDGHEGLWTGGSIYDPGSGRTYSCSLELESDYRARFRGYVGLPLLGRTTTWVRVGEEDRACQSTR